MADLAVVAYEPLRNPESVGSVLTGAVCRASVPVFVAVSDLDDTTIYVLDGSIEEFQDGTEVLQLFSEPYFSLLIATVN